MTRLLILTLGMLAASASAQPADTGHDERDRLGAEVAFRTAEGGPEAEVPGDSAFQGVRRDVLALRSGDAVLRDGATTVLVAPDSVVAFERRLGGERRVIVFNGSAGPRFLALPGEGVPPPFRPAYLSREVVEAVPSLVARLDDGDARFRYGLRVPARTTVVFRPATPADVRPRGLDE